MNWLREWLIELIREAVRPEMSTKRIDPLNVTNWTISADGPTPPSSQPFGIKPEQSVARVRAGIEPKPNADDFESLQREAIQQCEVEA